LLESIAHLATRSTMHGNHPQTGRTCP